jgi:hypothetical protein
MSGDEMKIQKLMTINDIRSKLSPEAQKWLQRMKRWELEGTEAVLNVVGGERFIQNWRHHQQELRHIRDFGVSLLPEPRHPPARPLRQRARIRRS